ncbi:hypothetical protein C8R46DRAFT_1188344 [Mycena filopes]|nr:hypothetical protein C8R46DRAFT_1188344 [Mycena filopes]
MSSSLCLDPSDPLNLLIKHTDDDSPTADTPPDWSSMNMWPADDKIDSLSHFTMGIDTDFGLMDYTDPIEYHTNNPYDPFQFTFEPPSPHMSSASDSGASTSGSFSPPPSMRTVSTSASVSGGYSPPPMMASAASAYSPAPSSPDFDAEDPATELANRVRKAAGIMHAVQIGGGQQQAQPQQQQLYHQQQQQQQLHPHSTFSSPSPSSPYPPPTPAFTTAPVTAAATIPAAPATQPQTQTRPKTSHTTIERRYRTNLNARIQSLRQAVPALRVVDRAAALKAGEGAPYTTSKKGSAQEGEQEEEEDIIDARGYVDGVKVARKCSKANVLGKAVEYIRVLKNRERRLTRELNGLKTLLRGLVGGGELLEAWEREWGARFGGGERDGEGVGVDGDGAADADADEDDEEGEEDEDDEGGGAGRKRKKARMEAAPKAKPKPAPAKPVVEGEKKKRGRPRKVVPLPVPAASSLPQQQLSTSVPMTSSSSSLQLQQHDQQQGGARQYLLGAFALFSVFANANVSSAPYAQSHPHAHEGHVLTPLASTPLAGGVGGGSMSMLQAFHLLASAAVLVSVVWPLGGGVWGRFSAAPHATTAAATATLEKAGTEQEKEKAREAAESDTETETEGSASAGSASASEEDLSADMDGEVQEDGGAVAAAEACILDDSTPLPTRLRAAVRLWAVSRSRSTANSTSTTSAPKTTKTSTNADAYTTANTADVMDSADAATDAHRRLLALLVRPVPLLGARLARGLWDGVEEAAVRVRVGVGANASTQYGKNGGGNGVLRRLEEGAVVARLRGVAGRAFVRGVFGAPALSSSQDDESSESKEQTRKEEEEERAALDCARRLGGRVGALGERVGAVVRGSTSTSTSTFVLEDNEEEDGDDEHGDVERLLRAILLYRRVFGSPTASVNSSSSPVSAKDASDVLARRALRRTLGSGDTDVFEEAGAAVEDARDRVVDLLTGEV